MDFSSDLEKKFGLDSPAPNKYRNVPQPSNYLEVSGVASQSQKELETVFSEFKPRNIQFVPLVGFVVGFPELKHAVEAIALLHKKKLADGR